jgi:hypothetical protein
LGTPDNEFHARSRHVLWLVRPPTKRTLALADRSRNRLVGTMTQACRVKCAVRADPDAWLLRIYRELKAASVLTQLAPTSRFERLLEAVLESSPR